MAKTRKYLSERIEKKLGLANKFLNEDKPLNALQSLRMAFNSARSYDGPERNNYLKRIEQSALILEQNEKLADYQYEQVEGIEFVAERLRSKSYGLQGVLPAIIGVAGLVGGLFFLSPNLTGKVTSNLTQNTSNGIGIVLIIMGAVVGLVYFRKSKV